MLSRRNCPTANGDVWQRKKTPKPPLPPKTTTNRKRQTQNKPRLERQTASPFRKETHPETTEKTTRRTIQQLCVRSSSFFVPRDVFYCFTIFSYECCTQHTPTLWLVCTHSERTPCSPRTQCSSLRMIQARLWILFTTSL